jgi:CHASE2 domain-containing sensor protein
VRNRPGLIASAVTEMKWFGNLRQRVHRPWFGSGLGAVLVPLVGLCLLGLPIGRGFVDWSYDLPFLMQPSQNITNVEIVTMDETLYHALGQSPARFDRTLHAQLVTNLNAQGAKLIVFDMVFLDAEPGTSHLAEAMQERTQCRYLSRIGRDPAVRSPWKQADLAAGAFGQ